VSVPAVGTAVTLLVSVMRAANLDVLVPTVTVDPACAVGHDVEVSAVPFELPESYRERLMSAADPGVVWYYTHAAGANQSVRVTVRADVEGRVLGATLFGQGENGTAHAIAGVACCVDQPVVISGAAVAAWRYTRFYVAPVAKSDTTVTLRRFSIEWEPVETGTSGHPHHAPSAGPAQVVMPTPFYSINRSCDVSYGITCASDNPDNCLPVFCDLSPSTARLTGGSVATLALGSQLGGALWSPTWASTAASTSLYSLTLSAQNTDHQQLCGVSSTLFYARLNTEQEYTASLGSIRVSFTAYTVEMLNQGGQYTLWSIPLLWTRRVPVVSLRNLTEFCVCEGTTGDACGSSTCNGGGGTCWWKRAVIDDTASLLVPYSSTLPLTVYYLRTADMLVNDTVWLHVTNPTTLGALIEARTGASSTTVAERQFVWALNRVYAQTHQPTKKTPVTLPLADWTLADVVADTRELAATATVLFAAWPADLPPDP
jgi:hypothetical protein